jgi:hypothetical protein
MTAITTCARSRRRSTVARRWSSESSTHQATSSSTCGRDDGSEHDETRHLSRLWCACRREAYGRVRRGTLSALRRAGVGARRVRSERSPSRTVGRALAGLGGLPTPRVLRRRRPLAARYQPSVCGMPLESRGAAVGARPTRIGRAGNALTAGNHRPCRHAPRPRRRKAKSSPTSVSAVRKLKT